jgi:hypothetical protein
VPSYLVWPYCLFWISFGPPVMYDTLLSGASTSNQYCPAPIIHYQKTFPRNSGYATQQRVAYL